MSSLFASSRLFSLPLHGFFLCSCTSFLVRISRLFSSESVSPSDLSLDVRYRRNLEHMEIILGNFRELRRFWSMESPSRVVYAMGIIIATSNIAARYYHAVYMTSVKYRGDNKSSRQSVPSRNI